MVSKPQMRWLVASIESSCADGSWSSTWLQCTVTASPGFQSRTAEPTRSTTPAASLPTTWKGWSWRAPHTLSRPRRLRNPNVGSGSKIDVHTVLKLIDDAITATNASSGASSGRGHVVDVQRLAGVLLRGRETLEHRLLVGPHHRAPIRGRQGQRAELVGGCAVDDGRSNRVDLIHGG